jgi:hypothetical protein
VGEAFMTNCYENSREEREGPRRKKQKILGALVSWWQTFS